MALLSRCLPPLLRIISNISAYDGEAFLCGDDAIVKGAVPQLVWVARPSVVLDAMDIRIRRASFVPRHNIREGFIEVAGLRVGVSGRKDKVHVRGHALENIASYFRKLRFDA